MIQWLYPGLKISTTQRKIVNSRNALAWRFTTAWIILYIGADAEEFSVEPILEAVKVILKMANLWHTSALIVIIVRNDGNVTLTALYLLSCLLCLGYGNFRYPIPWPKAMRGSRD